ncbi:leucine-rich repeat-containing protein 74A-like [Littorina saxatilis]|uniref:leucine-rich repeat-containing protein 74A-like n=1 Tax=Littorina saxatilis TaxID=31220 RepID=UPI0038B51129
MTTEVDLYTAPVDVNVKLMPGKVFKEPAAPSKHYRDRDCAINKDVFVEDGKRWVPRDGGHPSPNRKTSAEKRAADAAAEALRKAEEEAQRKGHKVSVVDIEDSSLFEVELNLKESREEFPGPYDPERARMLYVAACDMFGIVASSRFLRGVRSGRVVAGHQGFGPVDARAVAISLVTGLTVTELHIPGNMLGAQGMNCMAKLIHGNEIIKVLDISDNNLGREGAKVLATAIKDNDSLQEIRAAGNKFDDKTGEYFAEAIKGDISDNNLGREGAKVLATAIKDNDSLQEIRAAGNKFDDKTGEYFAEAIKVNTQIKQLDLSRNMLSIDGAIAIGKAMEDNETIIQFDLSYNHLRGKGIKGLAKMLAKNIGLLNLDISWNGVGTEGAKLLGEGLGHNENLAVLAVNGCRLNLESLIALLSKMKENRCLKSLQIVDNPITNADLCLFVKAIGSVPDCCLDFIDASSVMVSQECLDLVKQVGVMRPGFLVTYRGLLSIRDQSKNMLDSLDLTGGDPLEALIKYSKSKNLRLVDLFSRFDLDKSGTMTRQELIRGVATAGIPLSIKQMDKLVAKLDRDGDGEIDFSELLDGYKRYMRNLHRKGICARTRLKIDNDAFPGLTGEAAEDPAHHDGHVAETPPNVATLPGSRTSCRSRSRQQSQAYDDHLIDNPPAADDTAGETGDTGDTPVTIVDEVSDDADRGVAKDVNEGGANDVKDGDPSEGDASDVRESDPN